jgi:hypothetical protein
VFFLIVGGVAGERTKKAKIKLCKRRGETKKEEKTTVGDDMDRLGALF